MSSSWLYGTFASASSTFMCPGMRPATGWIAYLHLHAALLELIRERFDAVLRLRDGHAVPGNEDDLVGVREHDARRRRRSALRTCCGPPLRRRGLGSAGGTERAEEHVGERRFIALPISTVSSVPLAPTSAPQMISTLLPSTNPVIATASR